MDSCLVWKNEYLYLPLGGIIVVFSIWCVVSVVYNNKKSKDMTFGLLFIKRFWLLILPFVLCLIFNILVAVRCCQSWKSFMDWCSELNNNSELNNILFMNLKLLLVSSCIVLIFLLHSVVKIWKHKYKNSSKNKYTSRFQILIVCLILILIIYGIIEFKINKDSFLPLALITTICGWGLQDFFKGVVIRFNLWFNDLLCEGDFVNLSTYGVSGVVEDISLTSVNIRNLDGTILTIPILWFQSGAFVNHRKIQEGNVSGRRMSRSFLIDVQSISVVEDEMYNELLDIKMENRDICKEAIKKYKEEHSEVLNINLFMEYLKGYLISLNGKIVNNEGERFLVRLLESTPEGLPLQISATTMEKDLLSFEQVQSEFVEHVLLSMKWFGLKLYQKRLD